MATLYEAEEGAMQNAAVGGSARNLHADDDYNDLVNAALEDVARPGFKKRFASRFGSQQDVREAAAEKEQFDRNRQRSLVKRVMETSGGDNAALARKIHARFDAVGIKQPSVEVRFEDLTVSALVPEGSSDSIFTVGQDIKFKALGLAATAARQKPPMKEVKILHGVSGVLKPGRITLLLGPPGGGKSLLMKALCNSAPVPATGTVTYNGHKFNEFNVTRTARYVAQQDLHNPALTVRETLAFSARCQGAGYNRSMVQLLEEKEAAMGITPDPDVAKLMKHMWHGQPDVGVELTLQLLSLTNCADTVVGDGMTRGVSGGEKKRVTSGEMMVGPAKVLFMDEISTGLDSASTYTIVQSLANWAHATDSTITVALLQPEPQTYDLFDDVMVLAEGQIIYHGEREAVEGHFATLGFERPERKAVADFLQEIVSKKDQPALRKDPSKLHPELSFVPAAMLAEAFKATTMHQRTLATLAKPFDKSRSHPAALMKSKYGVSTWDAIKALTWRESILLTRNRTAQKYRYIQMVILSAVCAFLLLRHEVTNDDTIRGCSNALSAIFFSVAYMQFLGLAECADQLQRLPVFFKQRFNLFYPGWCFAVPLGLVKLPIMLLEVTYWSFFVYWIVGLETEPGRFFTFWATLLFLQIYSSSMYRFIGSAVRAMVTGTSVAVLTMLFTFMGSGFVLLRTQIPDWCIWIYWVSPLQYTLTGLANNEFSGNSYSEPFEFGNGSQSLGSAFLDSYAIPKGNFYRWLAPLILIGWAIIFNLLNMLVLSTLPPPPMPPPPPPTATEAELATQSPSAIQTSASDSAHSAHSDKVVVQVEPDDLKKKPAKGGGSMLNVPFTPVTLAFADLHYYVPNPVGSGELELLKGIYGVFRPGVLTALMGASGAGKSTLMDVLTDRKTTGRITGKVTVNGFDKDAKTFARVSGYGEQFDSHAPGATVEEAVRLSAALRLSKDFSPEQHEQFVQQTMDIVELYPIANTVVGIPGMYGLSGEQFKRLTIAVELVANPSIMFLDEPTSSLDARAAQIVMRVVRNIVNSNRTIVCTIHQPSAEIFFSFDEVLLLKRGGSTIYYGPLSSLVGYFEGIRGVKKMKPQYNPATYMLEVSTQAEEERLGVDFAEMYERELLPSAKELVEPHLTPAQGQTAIQQTSTFATGRWTQYKELLVRNSKSYWRNPPYNTTRLFLTVVAALAAGAFYWSMGDNYGSTADVTAVMGALFVSLIFLGFVNFQMVIPVFLFERPVFYRERAARMYSVLSWVTAMEDVEIPWITFQACVFSVIVYLMIHFEWEAGKFFFFLLVVWLALILYSVLGMLVVALTPNFIMGVTFGAMAQGLWFLFAGFLIPKPEMPPWLQWFYYLTPPGWAIYALVADQLGDKDDPAKYSIELVDGSTTTISKYISGTFDFEYSLRWMAVGILAAYVIAMRLGLAAAVKYLNFQNR